MLRPSGTVIGSLTGTGATLGATQEGMALTASAGGGQQFNTLPIAAGSTAHTIIVYGLLTTESTNINAMLFQGDESGAPYSQIVFAANSKFTNTVNSGGLAYHEYSGGWLLDTYSLNDPFSTGWQFASFAKDSGTSGRFYLNKRSLTTAVSTTGTIAGGVGTANIGNTNVLSNNRGCPWPIEFVSTFNRALSAEEIAFVVDNRHGLFAPLQRRIYVPSADTAIGVTTGVGALSVTGYAPTVTIPSVSVSTATGAITFSGNAPSVTEQIGVSTGTGAISVTGREPTVSLPWWQAFSLTINTGSIVSGTVPDTYTQNNTRLVLAETTGTPGFSYDFTFENVPENGARSVNFEGYYSGNLVHNVKIQQYNYTTTNWVNLNSNTTDIPDGTSDTDIHFSLLGSTSPYWSGGQLKLRIVHTSAGNPTHQLLIDEFVLNPEITVNAGETTLSLSGQAPTATAIDYDYLNASADVTDGNWVKSTDGTNTDLYTMLDEATIDDSDYIKTSTLDDECEIRLEAGSTPSISGYLNLQIKIPAGFSPTGTLTVTLVDNVTTVQQWASQSVSAGQLLDLAVTETVSSFSNLRVRLKATA